MIKVMWLVNINKYYQRTGGYLIALFIIILAILGIIGLITRVNHRKKQASEIASEVKQKLGK
ncbi:MAG: hypothetical protein IMF12_01540 [Proteobacteria bacterium]|nr:hypothetical protein [Pseudomonadota bacterium]